MKINPSKNWIQKGAQSMLIAGPCSAESEYQILTVAEELARIGSVHLLRAGVWKPRTRPNSFEGLGEKALPWLVKAQQEFGIPAVIEVANEDHVKAALDAGINHLWIGARTTVNPFSVQEIADELKGTDVPVFVKNPLNPDLQLWIGALERLNAAGITKLVGVHRGFSTYQDHVYRNSPNWEIPIELKVQFPDLEVLVDPSHIAGRRDILKDVAQKALDLGFDGLMIETHPDPDHAKSDPKQQIKLGDFETFINELETRKQHFQDSVAINKLERLRNLIDELDYNLLDNLKRRLDIVDQIGEYKAEHGVTVFQLERWRQIIEDRLNYAQENNIDSELIHAVWNEIHKASIRLQTDIVNRKLSS
ncbi:MAG: chorismate mutase [Flavobacteriales bacterium]